MNDMLANFVTAIQKLADDAAKNQPITTTAIHGQLKIVTLPDGSIERFVPISERTHTLLSVSEIGPFVSYHIHERSAVPVVWVSDDRITVVLNDSAESNRQNVAHYIPDYTDEFALASGCNRTFSQTELIDFLRLDLFGCLDDDQRKSLLGLFRKVKWSDDQQSRKGTVIHEVETGESNLTNEAGLRIAAFPDFITCRMPVFTDTALKTDYEVRLHLSVDPLKKNFSLRVVKSDVTAAVEESLCQIRELLSGIGCPVFLGTP